MFESEENSFEGHTDSDIDELSDLIGNLHQYCYEPEKVQVNQVEATMIKMKMRVVKEKAFLPTMSK